MMTRNEFERAIEQIADKATHDAQMDWPEFTSVDWRKQQVLSDRLWRETVPVALQGRRKSA